jgi:PKD repeat protein
MNSDARLRSLLNRSVRASAWNAWNAWKWLPALVVGLLLTGGPAFAADKTPAKPTPGPSGTDARWDTGSPLQPAAILGDSTTFAGHSDPREGKILMYHALDVEGGFLYSATGQGITVHDVKAGPTTAGASSYLYGWITGGDFPFWEHVGDSDWFLKAVDAPAGNENLAALTMDVQGFSVIAAPTPGNARVAYQAKTPTNGVYAVNVGGTDWAYALGDAGKVVRFNMTAAESMNKCLDDPIGKCPGVHKGIVTALGPESWVTLHGAGNFLAAGKWLGGGTVKIWSLADPAAPSLVLQIAVSARGVALWQSGGSYYLARIDSTGKRLSIHDVSCIAGGSCAGGAPEVWSTVLTAPTILPHVSVSQDGGKTYLYVGGDDYGSCVPQREYIFDATSPGSPTELTPKKHAAGYWGWYYQDCATGFNLVGPRIAKVYGGHLYRAAMSILDAHKVGTAGPPVANFSWSPSEIYPGTPVQFTDQSSGSPDSWTWNFQSATPSSSGAQNPSVSFSDDGEWDVSLAVSSSTNGPGVPVPPKKVKVLDPAPKLGGVTVSPAAPIVCQPVTTTAVGQGGQPVLSFKWEILNAGGTPVFTQTNGNTSQVWNTGGPPPAAAGSYTAKLTVSNGKGADAVQTAPFTLTAPASLPMNGQFTPACTNCTNGSPAAGVVKLSVNVPGATEWNWDFDGDNVFDDADWTSDPVTGPAPTHSYTSLGVRQVRVKVRNCLNQVGVISAPIAVDIKVITPLKALFSIQGGAFCFPGTDVCSVDGGIDVSFLDVSTGAEVWRFDWNGDGDYLDLGEGELDESDFTPVGPDARTIKHAFMQTGEFFPKLLVKRGASEENLYTLDKKLIVGTVQLPTISIDGPSSGKPSQALSFTASATVCSPNPSGWTWTAAGGTITGGNAKSVTITWSGLGNKSVSVSNSACGSASGSKTVVISNNDTPPPPPPPGLKAGFTYSPAAPAVGQAVAFDSASSTGSPTGWIWDFGDGSPFGTGAQASHTYAQPGSYNVQLSVTKPGNCAPAPFCEASVTKTVVVGTGEPPLGASFNTSAACISEFGLNTCTAEAGQAVTFTSTSTGNPTSMAWTFGDGGSGNGAAVTHTFQTAGTFTVTLNIGRGTNTASASKTFNVTGAGEQPLGASFQANASCGGEACSAQVGQPVTFTSTSTGNPVSLSWSFGDGGSGTGASVTHTFQTAGTFTVTLNIGKGANTASASKTFNVSGVVQPEAGTIVLPWVAQSRGALQQTSNLYIHNPGSIPMEIVLEFRRQGQPEANPPRSGQVIQPGATLYVGDVLKQLFNVENTIGFVTITKNKGDRNPVMTSFNNISGKKGSQYGQTIPSVALSREGTAAATTGSRMQYLVGLSDNKDRQAYFGLTNPNAEPAVYRLKFFDSLGRPIGTPSGDLTLPSFGARQYQLSEIRSQFGITAEDDYRVEVETVSGKQLYPYGTNVQTVSKDPSYQGAGQGKEKLYLIGAMRTKGSNKSEWQSDVVLSNAGAEVALADVSFLNAGPNSQPTAPLKITLQPGQTERLENVGRNWNVKEAVGLLTIESDAPNGLFPVVQGESYLSTKAKPGSRYGLAMAAFTDEDAAEAGEAHYMAGLRHDSNNRTTIWIYNNGNEAGTYDLIYRGLDGKVLGRVDNVVLGAGKLRQFNPSQHPLKALGKKSRGVPGGFTLQVVVKSGKVLAAAQVVNNKTNDPAYVQGQAQ